MGLGFKKVNNGVAGVAKCLLAVINILTKSPPLALYRI